jgi:hypothetical protein
MLLRCETAAVEIPLASATKRVGYVKEIQSEYVGLLCAEAPLLRPGYRVFILHDENGSPLLIAASHGEATADAASLQMETATLH